MKDVFKKKHIAEFVRLGTEFGESLAETFPDCQETKDWMLWYKNIIGDDPAKQEQAMEKWHAAVCLPLAKGTARYSKAVQCLTGQPATIYHAIKYHDADAVHANDEMLRALDFPSKLAKMETEDRKIFWEYMESMNDAAYKGMRVDAPSVPTPKEISDNIEQRKRGAAGSSEASLKSGVAELWEKLLTARNMPVQPLNCEDFVKFAGSATVADGSTLLKACQDKNPEAASALKTAFPDVGEADFEEEHWALYEKLLQLVQMESAIPHNMMRGIENVASKLVQDLENGSASLGDLDLDSIGKQVLDQVSTEDVSAFAGNLEKLLPMLNSLGK